MFEFINNSIRKLGSWLSSPTPASILGKRKTNDKVIGQSSILGHAYSDSHVYTTSDEDMDYYGYTLPQPPQKRIRKTTAPKINVKPATPTSHGETAIERADRVIQENRESLHKSVQKRERVLSIAAGFGVESDEQEIQEELDRQERQQAIHRERLHARQQKSQVSTKPKNDQDVMRAGFLQVQCCSKQPAHKSGVLETSDHKTPVDRHFLGRLNPMDQWHTKPHLRARSLLLQSGQDASALLKDLQEPAYVCRDAEIRDGIWNLMRQIEDFAKKHFSFNITDSACLRLAFERMAPETVNIIGCVASGGPAGPSGWEDLFLAADKRQALVCAIIGNVLLEQVFQHMFFGGTRDQINDVAAIQFSHRNNDGKSHTSFTKLTHPNTYRL